MATRFDDRLPGLLLVDRDSVARSSLARDMEGQGWQVWTAGDGRAALETYRLYRDRIDVAIVDLQLRGFRAGGCSPNWANSTRG